MNLFTQKSLETEFRDIPPDNLIDTNIFNQTIYDEIRDNGFLISPLKVIHSSSVHYQSRFKNSTSLRFLNAFINTISTINNTPNDGRFYLNDIESSELQQQSSEVIGVGLAVAISAKLFEININRFLTIEESGKRCDFSFEKNGLEYLLESKARKNDSSINQAIKDAIEQKDSYQHSRKFGVISHLPRNGNESSLIVIDPTNHDIEITRRDLVIRLLKYYSKVSILSGFWRLSEKLNERIRHLESSESISEFENISIEYENVYKLGTGYNIELNGNTFEAFFNSNENIGFRKVINDKTYFFAVDRELIKIIERQDFESLIEYTFNPDQNIDTIRIGYDNGISINNDGSVLFRLDNLQ